MDMNNVPAQVIIDESVGHYSVDGFEYYISKNRTHDGLVGSYKWEWEIMQVSEADIRHVETFSRKKEAVAFIKDNGPEGLAAYVRSDEWEERFTFRPGKSEIQKKYEKIVLESNPYSAMVESRMVHGMEGHLYVDSLLINQGPVTTFKEMEKDMTGNVNVRDNLICMVIRESDEEGEMVEAKEGLILLAERMLLAIGWKLIIDDTNIFATKEG